jgi:hypothetical protein
MKCDLFFDLFLIGRLLLEPPTVETVGHGIAVNILSFHYAIADGFNRWGSVINLDNFKKNRIFPL